MPSLRKIATQYLQHLLALAGMVGLALAVTVYVSVHERLRFPWQHETRIYAEFENAQSVTPGQGQTVNVAGVKVGEIGGVTLKEGRAVVELDIQSRVPGGMYRSAHLQLRPKTGLNDMAIEMDPGRPDPSLPDRGRLHDGSTLPIENTRPNVNPDEVLASLDADTRAYLAAFVDASGQGLRGRGADLRRVLRATQPTFAQTSRIARAIADRRTKLARLVTNLHRLASAAAGRDADLGRLVDSSSAVFGTLAARDADLQSAVARLPGALHATRNALVATRGLAVDARPALTALLPVAQELAPALVQARPLLSEATPVVANGVRPFVRAAIPLLAKFGPELARVDSTTPGLVDAGHALNRVANELAYNPPGKEEGYLFWLPWFMHNSNSVLSIEDAHGAAFRGLVLVGCTSLPAVILANPALFPFLQLPLCPIHPAPPKFKPGSPDQIRSAIEKWYRQTQGAAARPKARSGSSTQPPPPAGSEPARPAKPSSPTKVGGR
ncbi:MAG: MCE family protein [Actinobacteria bacterium]|nr:MCE family protein [Actinomycetota bacterium]